MRNFRVKEYKMRDDFDNATKDTLAKRVGFRCSNPNCRQLTSGPQKTKNKSVNIGVASHITAASKRGPRYDPNITPEERKSIKNGIWLCQNHAKLIDNDEKQYTADLLKEWKRLSENAALLEIEKNIKVDIKEDKEILKSYAQCFDRPAFQDYFKQEGSMEAFDKAIEDTIIALNTGTLRARDGTILFKSKGKSFIANDNWRNKLDVIVDLLRAIRERYSLALRNQEISLGQFHAGRQYYCINNRELSDWFDSTRNEILKIFSEICNEAGIHFKHSFPRNRRYW